MHVRDALEQLDQIHDHLTRSEVYRGFRVPAVAAVGVLAFVAAAMQPAIPAATAGIGFVWFWVAVAGACGLLGAAAAGDSYATRGDEFCRRRTRQGLAPLAPCVRAGVAAPLALGPVPGLVALLPGLWAAIFGWA